MTYEIVFKKLFVHIPIQTNTIKLSTIENTCNYIWFESYKICSIKLI